MINLSLPRALSELSVMYDDIKTFRFSDIFQFFYDFFETNRFFEKFIVTKNVEY